jgi:hypothetical protein
MKKKSLFFLTSVILMIGILSCNHRQKRNEMVLQSMKLSINALEKHNEVHMHSIQIISTEHPERAGVLYEKIMMPNSYSKSFKESVLRNENYDRLKLVYVRTMDSLSRMFDHEKTGNNYKDLKAFFNVSSLNFMVDSTLNYYSRNKIFGIQKMQYDITLLCNKINNYLIFQFSSSEDCFETGIPMIERLRPRISVKENYSLLIHKPFCKSTELNVIIDNITFGNKEVVPYHLYPNVSLLSFDSTLQSGDYNIYGKILYKLNDAPASFIEKKIRQTIKVY